MDFLNPVGTSNGIIAGNGREGLRIVFKLIVIMVFVLFKSTLEMDLNITKRSNQRKKSEQSSHQIRSEKNGKNNGT